MKNGMTIIICTHNGAARLSQTIIHIAQQIVSPSIHWEVILADNGSSDDTIKIAETIWNANSPENIPFRIIKESKPGKLFALQKAIQAAEYEFLIICDDDNWLAPDYIEKAYNILHTMPEVAAAGGRGIPATDASELPDWFAAHSQDYATGPQADKNGILKPGSRLWGAGLVTRRSVYLNMYKDYQSFLVESEVNVLSAEDTEYCLRLTLKGYKLYYDDRLVYQHFIGAHKLNIEFRDQLVKGFRDSDAILLKYYVAIKVHMNTGRSFNRTKLLLAIPFRLLFAFSKRRTEKARNILFHLLPFDIPTDDISKRIKAFIQND